MNNDIDFQERVYTHIGKYTTPSWTHSILEMTITIMMIIHCFNCESLLMVPVFAMVFIRTFVLFHDTGHNTFFPSKRLNRIFGLLLGTITFTPFSYWVKEHKYHHSNANKINVDQHAQTSAWDVEKYEKSSYISKLIYKLVYGKYTLFTINPLIYFMVINRYGSNIYESLLQIIYVFLLYLYLSPSQYLYVVMSVWMGSIVGFMLFHAQHTFDYGYRDHEEKWNYFLNGMYGSSFIQLPWFLSIFTCNIEYHHIHHLNSHVPSYNLNLCHEEGCELFKDVKKLYVTDIIKSLGYSLYDATRKTYVDVYRLM